MNVGCEGKDDVQMNSNPGDDNAEEIWEVAFIWRYSAENWKAVYVAQQSE